MLGKKFYLHLELAYYDLCKYCFANRIVNIWNSLHSHVVFAETVNCFGLTGILHCGSKKTRQLRRTITTTQFSRF